MMNTAREKIAFRNKMIKRSGEEPERDACARYCAHLVLGLGAALPVLDGRVAPDALLTAEPLLLLRSHDTPAQLHV